MKKTKYYPKIKFQPDAIRAAVANIESAQNEAKDEVTYSNMSVDFGGEHWSYDTDEEFYSDCRKECKRYYFCRKWKVFELGINYMAISGSPKRWIALIQLFHRDYDLPHSVRK